VRFCGYAKSLGMFAPALRLSITRSNALGYLARRTLLQRYYAEIRQASKDFQPDIVLAIKGEVLDSTIIDQVKKESHAKMVLWYVDDPRYYGTIIKRIIRSFDYVYTVSPRAVNTYKEMGARNVGCLPVACDPSFHRKLALSPEDRDRYSCDIVFAGTYYPRRAGFVNGLKKAGVRVRVYGDYWNLFWMRKGAKPALLGPEMVKSFNAAKIVLNVHADSDVGYKVNTRTFEATGCGSFVLSDRTYGVDDYFEVGKELACYDNEAELLELAKYYLDSDAEREEVSLRGHERTYRDHTYALRMTQVLEDFK
jgi:spore maturation protein CgeB